MRVLDRIDRREIASLRERDEFFWLDLHAPGDRDVDALGELFGLHPLVLEDLRHFRQRPKLESYGDYVLLVFYGVGQGERTRPRLIEVECIISGGFIITVHREPCDELVHLRRFFEERGHEAEQWVVYRILDALTDSFFPVLSGIDDQIDELEEAVIQQPTDEQLQRLFRLKRDLVGMRKVVTPQRDLFARAADEIVTLPGLEPSQRDYMRDVYDHLIRISDLVDSYRDLLSSATDVYLSTVSNRLNVVMKRLTVIATIFLPLTFVTGFFGQNFGWMVEHVDTLQAFLAFGVGLLLATVVGLVVWFRRTGLS